MEHELNKLDRLLQLTPGTAYKVIIQHQHPGEMNHKLAEYDVILDDNGMLPKNQLQQWQKLCLLADISKRYWKDQDLLNTDKQILDLVL